ncbi:MAG: quinone-dependent dihydroorotate dehydrogenase [Anaerolineales bacterium]|nr:quinone-dependent dihydroorotate dehydrogenase [Anaerolineales bacterium]
MYERIRPILFKLEPERAHHLTLRLLSLAGSVPLVRNQLNKHFSFSDPLLETQSFGLDFKNPVGLAGGYDKDGIGMQGLACLGFGHIELGTVTLKPQGGNPRPRVFRLIDDQGLINRMGSPNEGGDALLKRIRKWNSSDVVLGVNIGKGVDTPIEEASGDYVQLLQMFYSHVDYLAVNVSSPNTIGLRQLQARDYLEGLLATLMEEREILQEVHGRMVPLLVKLAPDLTEGELDDALGVIMESSLDGVIATNTTVERGGLSSQFRTETGGLSGIPLRERAREVVSIIYRRTSGVVPIIGVGGIFSFEDAKAMFDAGASLIQIYTGMVYRGPGLVREILEGLATRD